MLERLRDLRMAQSLEDQAQRVDDLESQLEVAVKQNRIAALQMVHADKAITEKERVTSSGSSFSSTSTALTSGSSTRTCCLAQAWLPKSGRRDSGTSRRRARMSGGPP